ncbi:MAG TPA: hypothetical protein VIL44_04435 [Micromonospora sp.]
MAMATFRHGLIEYRGDRGLRGQERWSVSIDDDGTKTLSAHCRITDTRLERWVLHSVDARMRPLRSFVSQRHQGQFLGEGRFWFEPGLLSGHSHTRAGLLSQQLRIDGDLDFFVPHAVAADAWITPACPRHGDWHPVRHGYASSLLADGSTGPLIEHHPNLRIRFVGHETVRVPAGEFATSHFVVSVQPGIVEHLWVTDDDFVTLVQLRSDRLATTYVLAELVEDEGWPSPPTTHEHPTP